MLGLATGSAAVARFIIPKVCERELRDVSKLIAGMQWPEEHILPRYLQVFKEELKLFAVRVDDARTMVRRCPLASTKLKHAADNLKVQLDGKTVEVINRWMLESLESCDRGIEKTLARPTTIIDDYKAITRDLVEYIAALDDVDALRLSCSWIPQTLREELASKLEVQMDDAKRAFGSYREQFRVLLRDQLWTGVRGLQAPLCPGDLERFEAEISAAAPLHQRDKDILLHELRARDWRRSP